MHGQPPPEFSALEATDGNLPNGRGGGFFRKAPAAFLRLLGYLGDAGGKTWSSSARLNDALNTGALKRLRSFFD